MAENVADCLNLGLPLLIMGTSVSSAYFATALFAISFNEITMTETTMPRTTSVTPMRKVLPDAT
ncbi:hypothetical protein, partial [Metallibacterium scheffleri]|uniref:hypothetical protein n=1 Tax=Metallibacterium scheffleri TaxID=993689 RepID=UPI0023F36A3B